VVARPDAQVVALLGALRQRGHAAH
jgi:hypothetical protein